MDIWHRMGKIFCVQNLGTLIFFLLNVGLLLAIFCPCGVTASNVIPLVAGYITTVLISLSPVGEWLLAVFAGATEIKRTDIKIRLIPLLEITLGQAKEKTPSMASSISLKIIHDPSPNAFAIGKRTICVTEGLLKLADQEIMAIFAHELGHIAYKHSAIQLLIGGGNLFISGCLLIIKFVCWMVTAVLTLLAISTRHTVVGVFITLVGFLASAVIWLWTKFCMLFLMWSMRQNEFVADEYACSLGYGVPLASVLDRHMFSAPENGLLKALYSTHPHSDDRIARLQKLGVNYSRY